ncbi:hypothetical protein MUK42_02865 [Musa troglodytarum]|nr:hypothetical protein MUK42_02865 [Musa troglodytarum]
MARVAAAAGAVDKVVVEALDMGLGRAQAQATVRALVVVRAEVMGAAEAVEAAVEWALARAPATDLVLVLATVAVEEMATTRFRHTDAGR